MRNKASADEIRRRFDEDVERFSDLERGQATIIDAPVMLELASACAAAVTPDARHILDIGCGAGNYALMLLRALPGADVTLLDLSGPMLERACERVGAATQGAVEILQGDIRSAELGESAVDVVVAAASLHHLREDEEWEAVFSKVRRALRPGGSFWIADFVEQVDPRIHALMQERYGEFLLTLLGPEKRDHALEQIRLNDTPRSIEFQSHVLYRAGFSRVDIVHKNNLFALLGAMR